MNQELLKMHLALSVPLEVDRLSKLSARQRGALVAASRDTIGEGGFAESVMFLVTKESKHVPRTAEEVGRLTRALALLAFAPRGVRFLSLRWEAAGGIEISEEARG